MNPAHGPHQTPILNAPMPLKILALLMVTLHLPTALGLQQLADDLFQVLAFVPGRFTNFDNALLNFWAVVLSPLGYTLLHANWLHLCVNLGMLLAFGKVLWRARGGWNFGLIYAIGALAGAMIMGMITANMQVPMIGASAAVSALIGALCAQGITQSPSFLPFPFDRRARSAKMMLMCIGLNMALAVLPHAAFSINQTISIAWQAHLAGLAAGFLYLVVYERLRS